MSLPLLLLSVTSASSATGAARPLLLPCGGDCSLPGSAPITSHQDFNSRQLTLLEATGGATPDEQKQFQKQQWSAAAAAGAGSEQEERRQIIAAQEEAAVAAERRRRVEASINGPRHRHLGR